MLRENKVKLTCDLLVCDTYVERLGYIYSRTTQFVSFILQRIITKFVLL